MHTFARVNTAMWWRRGQVHERVPCSFVSQLANENRHTVSEDSVPCSFLKNNLYFSVVLYFTVDKYSPLNLIFICYFAFFLNLAFTIFKLRVWVYSLMSWWVCGGWVQPLVLVIAFCGFETGSHCSLLAHEPMESSCLCLPSSWRSEGVHVCHWACPSLGSGDLNSRPHPWAVPLFILIHLATSLTFRHLEVIQNLDFSRRRADF